MIELKDLKMNEPFNIDTTIDLDLKSFKSKSVSKIEPCKIEGVIIRRPNAVKVNVQCNAKFTLLCNKCLAECEKDLECSVNARYKENQYEYTYSNGVLDLKKDIEREMYLEVPDWIYCSEDCKGLCPVCGANLNKTKCNCKLEE